MFWSLLPLLYLAVASIPLVWIDIRQHRLPNVWVLPGYAVVLISVFGQWFTGESFPFAALCCAVGFFLFLLLLSIAGGMGMGDVKLAGVLGGAAGMFGWDVALWSVVLAFLQGGAASLLLVLFRRQGRRSRVPFGPFLLLGFWAALLPALFIE